MKKILSFLLFALIGHFSYSQNYTPQESNKRSIYLMPVRVDSVASSAYKRVITRYLNGAYGTVVSASTYTSNGEERIMVSRTSSTTITLGSKDCVQGKSIIIQDLAGTRSSGNYIQIQSSTGNVNGASYLRIETGGGSSNLYFDGTNWKINSLQAPWDGAVLLVSDGHLTGYSSIDLAMAAAVSGDVIVLQDDIEMSTGLTITSGVSINGNGKNYTVSGSDAVDAFYITGGTTKIFNFKKIESTRTGSAARWLFACFGENSKMYVDCDELKVADGCVGLAGNDGSKLTINARKIDLGTYDASAGLNNRKFLSTNKAWIKVSGATMIDSKVISSASGFVGSVVRNGSVLATTSDTTRSVLEFENVEFDVSRGIALVERMGELRMKNVKAKTLAKTAISMAGDPYVSGASTQNHYNKAILTDCEFLGGSLEQGIYFTSLISLTADNSQGFDTNFQDVYWYGTNYLNTNTINSIYNSHTRYTMKNYGTLIYNGPISGETFTYNQPIPLGATLVGGGSVTSVGVSVPTGFGVTGSPVTGAGTIAITTSLSGMTKGTGSGLANATAGTDYVAGGTGTTNNLAKFTASGTIGNSIASDDGSKMTVSGGADALLVTSSGSGVTSEIRQLSNNDVLHRFKRNGGNYWDTRYYYTGEALKFRYNDADRFTLNSDGSASLSGALSLGSALGVANGGTGATSFTANRILYGNGTSALNSNANLTYNGTTFAVGNTTASSSSTTGSATFAGGIGVAGRAVIYSNPAFTGSITSLSADIGVGGTSHGFGYYNNGNTIELGVIAYGNLVAGFEGYDKERSFKLNGDNTNTFIQLSSFLPTYTNNTSNWYTTIAGMSRILAWNRELRLGSNSNNVSIFSGYGSIAALTANSTKVDFPYTTASTSTSTGSATFGGGIGVAGRASLASAVVNTTLSVNGLTAGATSDTTVVINAGVLKKVKMPVNTLSGLSAGSASDTLLVINAGTIKKVVATSALTTTGVTAGAFGSASAAPIITVGTDGRITSITTTSITASTTVSLYVRPETHGAVGNGSTDDATAFQTAINTCTSGCVILLSSSKNYRINTMLTVLDNMIFMSDGGNATITSGISGVAHTFYVNNKDNVHFRDINFTLSGSPSNTNVAGHILFNRSKYSSVRNCTFTKSHWFDIQIKGEAAENSENIIIDGNKSLQLAAEGGSGNSPCSITVWGYARNITITNNQSLGVGAMGIAIQNFGGTGTINYVYVAGNTIRGKDTYGIMAYDANANRSVVDIQIVNNHVEDINGVNGVTGNAGAGIYLASCFDCLVQGNYVKNSNFGTTGNSLAPGGIGINDADNCIISDNKIVECDYHAITVRNTDGFTLTGNNIMAPRYMAIEVWQSSNGTITGNRMSSATNTEQMYYVKGSSDIVFSGNIVNCTGNYRVVDLDGSTANYRCVISNNNFNYSGTSNVLMLGSTGTNGYFQIKGNIFRNNTSNGTKRGVSFTSITNSDIEGNSFLCASGQDAALTSGTCTATRFQNNILLGNLSVDTGTTGLVFTLFGTAAPSAAGYAVGSRVYNSTPSGSGSAYGWIYTSGGTWRTISTL